ncbi:MAG: DUF364 domain-containing protein [Rubrivivax sp.]|nr:DUF364 domain-containing protein [Rubrivivax sp.]
MRFAEELHAQLRQAFAGRAVPRVKALHLPPVPWAGTRDGEFGALELDSGALGLSYVLLDDTLATLAQAGAAVQGADALDVASWWVEGAVQGRAGVGAARRALGFAAVNALTRELFDRAGFVPPAAADSIGGLAPQSGEHIGMVGFFPPLVKQVTAHGARLTVLELRADLAGKREGFSITLDPAELAGCTQVLCTSTVLLNHTLEGVLAACRSARHIALVGPGAGCLPDGLFARGVTLLGGTWVLDAVAFRNALAAGAPWGRATRKFALTRDNYQGLPTLLSATGP